jgi:soluble lytic murein transglycosylase
MNQRFGALTCLFTVAVLAAVSYDSVALARHKQSAHAKRADAATGANHKRKLAQTKTKVAAEPPKPVPSSEAPAPAPVAAPLSGDLAAVKQAFELVRKGKTGDATAIKNSISEPAAQKLVEWLILRHSEGAANFGRYAAFIADNPNWPSIRLLRRRAEARLWQERSDATTVRRFTQDQPLSG